jgi:hypothetical protein
MRVNYSGNKRKKEEARRKKQEEKREKRLNKNKTPETPSEPEVQ